jgi:CheY-like chemotaxis protein
MPELSPEARPGERSARSRSMLLVEDNEDDVFLLQRALKYAGIENPLHIVQDGEAALAYLSGAGVFHDRTQHPLPFIVFLDLKLPYLNGFEVLTWIRSQESLANLIVVVMTSSAEARDHEQAYALGARSYLVKPPTPQMLLELVRSLESFWPKLGATEVFRLSKPKT